MNCSEFLSDLQDRELRKCLWTHYIFAEKEAIWFGNYFGNWIPVRQITTSPDSGWDESGRIHIPPDYNNIGVLFHEVFHSAFHKSPLWHDHQNKWWGDAFCDAFRYYVEKIRLVGQSNWLSKDFMPYFGDRNRQEQDCVRGWGSIIVEHNHFRYKEFKKFWIERNKDSNNFISTILGI